MAGCKQRPRCHKTKSRRCIKPNPWLTFLNLYSGEGKSRVWLTSKYKIWKKENFGRFSSSSKAHVARRQNKLCDMSDKRTALLQRLVAEGRKELLSDKRTALLRRLVAEGRKELVSDKRRKNQSGVTRKKVPHMVRILRN